MVDSTNLPNVDINQIATDLNGKMDRDGVNASCPTLLSRTANSYGGVVEIWSDGYCVQTGASQGSTTYTGTTVTLDQPYKDTSFKVFINISATTNGAVFAHRGDRGAVNSFQLVTGYQSGTSTVFYGYYADWRTEGYIR